MNPQERLRVVAALVAALALPGAARAGEHPIADVKFASPGSRVVVQAMLGKRGPYAMLLDTSTDLSVIDAALGRQLLAVADAAGAGAGTGPAGTSRWDMVGLRIGHLRADTVAAEAVDLGKVSEQVGTHLDGVLGYSFLRGRIVQIDYRRHRVRFYRESPSWSGFVSEEFSMTLGPGDRIPRFTGRIDRHDAVLLFDTGLSAAVVVFGGAIPYLKLEAAFAAATPDSAPCDSGSACTRVGHVPSVELGQIRFADVPGVFHTPGYGLSWDRETPAATIGGALLEGVVVTLDYPHRSIRFER
jgi:hypothetical protein